MSIALSLDLRVRVLAAVAAGSSHQQAGERFGVSSASVSRWRALARERGDPRPRPMGGDPRSRRIESHDDMILAVYEGSGTSRCMNSGRRWRSVGCWSAMAGCGASSGDAPSP